MQACEGYVENGQFYPTSTLLQLPGRLRAILTILDEPEKKVSTTDCTEWLSEFHNLVVESSNEELNIENFPRTKFNRKPIQFEGELS